MKGHCNKNCPGCGDDPATRSFGDLKYYSPDEVKGQLQEVTNTLAMLKEAEQ